MNAQLVEMGEGRNHKECMIFYVELITFIISPNVFHMFDMHM